MVRGQLRDDLTIVRGQIRRMDEGRKAQRKLWGRINKNPLNPQERKEGESMKGGEVIKEEVTEKKKDNPNP